MQISSTTNYSYSIPTRPAAKPAPEPKPIDDLNIPVLRSVTRSTMPKNATEAANADVVISSTLFLTKDDIALIHRTTGVQIDYETGEVKNDDPRAFDFLHFLTDLRYEAFARAETPKELTADAMFAMSSRTLRSQASPWIRTI